eukprot:g237.t1
MKIRDMRKRLQLTQADLAERMGTTQQTIARWETGKTELSIQQLKDLAVELSCSVSDLIGRSGTKAADRSPQFACVDHEMPYGALSLTIESETREYPIDEAVRSSILEQLSRFDIRQASHGGNRWIVAATLNNRLLLINARHVKELELVSDDAEAMPSFAHPEVYASISNIDTETLSAAMQAKIKEEFEDLDLDQIDRIASCFEVIFEGAASTETFFLTPDVAVELEAVSMFADEVAENAFLLVEEEGFYRARYINLSRAMKRAAIYLRVSTDGQTTENQRLVLERVAERSGWEVVEVYEDHGISGAKGRKERPAYDRLCKDANRRRFDVVMAWSVDRLGRSLQDLVSFLGDLHAVRVDLFLHQQGIDTTTPAGKAMFQMMGVFAEFERAMIQDRIKAGLDRARANGKRLGRPPVDTSKRAEVLQAREQGLSVRRIAERVGLSTGVTKAELSPWRALVRRRRARNPENPFWSSVEARWGKVVENARQELARYDGGVAMNRNHRQACEEIVRVADDVEPHIVAETALAMIMMQQDRPSRFRSDDAFWHQLSRRVRGLTDLNVGEWYDHKTAKVKRVYRDIPAKTSALLGKTLAEIFGLPGVLLAKKEREQAEQARREREELAGFAEALQ